MHIVVDSGKMIVDARKLAILRDNRLRPYQGNHCVGPQSDGNYGE
jgi:hypothetical protein